MRKAVLDRYVEFTAPLEGVFLWMYQDVKGLITTGIGNLIDASQYLPSHPETPASMLPWKHPDGTPATPAEIAAEWLAFKAQPEMAHYPASSKKVQNATTLRLTMTDVLDLVDRALLANEDTLKKVFGDWDRWPADAQMAALSMTWAVGANVFAEFGNCKNSLLKGHFHEVTIRATSSDGKEQASECDISTHNNAGIVPRNAQNRLCFNNAQIVVDAGLDPEVLYWPKSASDSSILITPFDDHGQSLQQAASLALANWTMGMGAWDGHSGADVAAEST
jgi:hypothetical protein